MALDPLTVSAFFAFAAALASSAMTYFTMRRGGNMTAADAANSRLFTMLQGRLDRCEAQHAEAQAHNDVLDGMVSSLREQLAVANLQIRELKLALHHAGIPVPDIPGE